MSLFERINQECPLFDETDVQLVCVIWLIGVCIGAWKNIDSMRKLRLTIKMSRKREEKEKGYTIIVTDEMDSFSMGVLKPIIVLPQGLEEEEGKSYPLQAVLAHEK